MRRVKLAIALVREWWHEAVLGHKTYRVVYQWQGTVEVRCATCRRTFFYEAGVK
jgi:hypothetical protein